LRREVKAMNATQGSGATIVLENSTVYKVTDEFAKVVHALNGATQKGEPLVIFEDEAGNKLAINPRDVASVQEAFSAHASVFSAKREINRKKRVVSEETRRRMSESQKLRWARRKAALAA
jgi:hypothetical protein